MACSAVRAPILRNPSVRNYAAAAKAAQVSSPATDHKILPNKITCAALDNNSPVAQVSIVFKVGSRNETYETQGITHLLRLAAGLTTSRSSTFGIIRNIQQLGGNLFASADRESIAYTLQVTRNNLEKAFMFLEDTATRQVFKPWEISDMEPRVRYDRGLTSDHTRLIENLHKAAYRTGLGFSLIIPKRQIGKLSTEALQHHVQTWFTGSRCAVVGTGVSLNDLNALASSLQLSSGNANSSPSKYWGGEVRKERDLPTACVAIAVEGAGFDHEKDALAFAVLKLAAGVGPQVKWGNSITPLQKIVGSAVDNNPFAVSAFNASYSDSGLFGVVLEAPASVAGAATKAAYKWMLSPNLTDDDIKRGKNQLKTMILDAANSHMGQLEALIEQTLYKGHPVSLTALAAEVDNVSASDVKKVAGKLGGKPSMAAFGNISTVPHVDQLS